MIETKECSFFYNGVQNPAVCDISLQVKKGECILLTGKSGCGKTTFTRLLNGLSPCFFTGRLEGECRVDELIAGQAKIEEYVPKVGSVFQNPKTQYFNINTTSELAFPCENSGMETMEIQRRVEECVREFGLEKLMNRSIFQLSGGEKQKISFAAANMLKPLVLVLDEPTSNLDESAIRDLHDMIAKMKEMGITIVIAEHRLAWICDLVDSYYYFENGKLQGTWSKEEFLRLDAQTIRQMGLRSLRLDKCRAVVEEKKLLQPSNEHTAITIRDLVIGYDKKSQLRKIEQFQINHGEILGLMGLNGAGKSTFAKTLCGLLKPISGEVLWNGQKIKPRAMIHHSFMVMQDVNYQLFSDSVREEVLLGTETIADCESVLQTLNLTELSERHPMSLSGGQKQRVAIASAILSGKELIVFDEPTSGLDYYHMEQVGQMLQYLKKMGNAVLVITHDDEMVADWCDRVEYFE